METRTYTIPVSATEDLMKKLRTIQRKADRLGVTMNVTCGDTYGKLIPVYATDPENGAIHQVDEVMYAVFDLTIESEIVKKDGWTVEARLEHTDKGNFITTFGDAEKKAEWYGLEARCEHCGGKHRQKYTYIVTKDGKAMQVGRTCLKEYTGIDPQNLGMANDLNEIVLGYDIDHYDFGEHPAERAYDLENTLALAIGILYEQGYVKADEPGSNKSVLMERLKGKAKATEEQIEAAREIISGFRGMDREEAMKGLILEDWMILQNSFVLRKHMGRMAYIPRMWEKLREKLAREAEREQELEAERNASDHVGKVGDRIDVYLKEVRILTSYETEWGFTHIYKLVDEQNNTLIWKTSGTIKDGTRRIKATVKEHKVYNGIKQTVLTRCKAVG